MKGRRKTVKERMDIYAIKHMPPLRHSTPGSQFDIMNSEVAEWLVSLPEIRQLIIGDVLSSDFITYNRDTGTWQGINFDD